MGEHPRAKDEMLMWALQVAAPSTFRSTLAPPAATPLLRPVAVCSPRDETRLPSIDKAVLHDA